jgi:outer membrane protein TolC
MLSITPVLRTFSILLVVLGIAVIASAQNARVDVQLDSGQSPGNAPITLTLQDAIARARKIDPQFRAALTEFGMAKEDRVQSRANLLPNVSYNAQFLYTEGNGTPSARFIANNGVHEYVSEGNVHQGLSLANVADYRRTLAAEAVAKARTEIAARGLVVTVVQSFYGFVVDQRKYGTAQKANDEAKHFLDISQKLEHGGEVAHSDVIKAQIQAQQKERDFLEAQVAMERSRVGLAVLLFMDFNQNFSVVDDLQSAEPLPDFSEVRADAAKNNPDLRAALAAVREAGQEVAVAWNGLLPSLSVDYFYGIDANRIATSQLDPTSGRDIRNLGYAATASLQLPVWNWGASRSKIKQANLRQAQARVELSSTQRQLLGNLQNFYNEARAARLELDSLNQSAQLAAESLRLTTMRYQAGEATVLEVVDAQNTSAQARDAFDEGQERYRVAIANLQTLTGSF